MRQLWAFACTEALECSRSCLTAGEPIRTGPAAQTAGQANRPKLLLRPALTVRAPWLWSGGVAWKKSNSASPWVDFPAPASKRRQTQRCHAGASTAAAGVIVSLTISSSMRRPEPFSVPQHGRGPFRNCTRGQADLDA